jgi:hypothetical protein
VFAVLSTFGLPWSGVPVSYYVGIGSWIWFLCAGISLGILRDDGQHHCMERRCFVIFNMGAVLAAIYAFMYKIGVPGDIPGIEGIAAINSLEGLAADGMMFARILFLISGIVSFAAVYSPGERAHAMLSFSYSAFLALSFLPPAHLFFEKMQPRAAIMADAAAYFAQAELIHVFVMGYVSQTASSRWTYPYAVINAALSGTGIYFLFSAL